MAVAFYFLRIAKVICCIWLNGRRIRSLEKCDGTSSCEAGTFARLPRRLVQAATLEMFDERSEGFFTDMVFHAFSIRTGDGVGNAD